MSQLAETIDTQDLIVLIAQQCVSENGEYTAFRISQDEVSEIVKRFCIEIHMLYRGIGAFCYQAVQTRGTNIQFVCGSGPNTVLAVSYCARQLGVEAIIVVPKATNERICQSIRTDGSHLILYGENWTAAEVHARKLVRRNG